MPKQKFPEAEARLFSRVYICMKCGGRIKADASKVKAKKIKCRKCKSRQLRLIHKDRKV
ncbi:MAG: 50S ribosomal protein L40e [Candidatus Aenigmarchaeota archaeon]|nr:50S ribosomal protein L40e [Candidatus Aenigmarchaeota archaeon]